MAMDPLTGQFYDPTTDPTRAGGYNPAFGGVYSPVSSTGTGGASTNPTQTNPNANPFQPGTFGANPTPTSAATPPPATGGNKIQPGQDPQSYLVGLLNSGMSPQQAIDLYNSQGLPNAPAYYPGSNTIGLSNGFYLEDSGGAGKWGPVQRVPETGATRNAVNPAYLAPFGQAFNPNAFGQTQVPPFSAQFQTPGAFQPPTAQSILQDPSYQFRLNQAEDQLTKTRAAQGLFNSGGTVYDVANLASNFAGQEYGNIWNRDFNQYQQQWQDALAKYNAQIGGYNANLSGINQAYNQGLTAYQTARDTFYANQNNPYQKLFGAANLGVGAATTAG